MKRPGKRDLPWMVIKFKSGIHSPLASGRNSRRKATHRSGSRQIQCPDYCTALGQNLRKHHSCESTLPWIVGRYTAPVGARRCGPSRMMSVKASCGRSNLLFGVSICSGSELAKHAYPRAAIWATVVTASIICCPHLFIVSPQLGKPCVMPQCTG
jgi:hypothetical protein